MRKKIFIISIPMLPMQNLKKLRYRLSDGSFSSETAFPGIAMLEQFSSNDDSVKVVTVRTDDENGRTQQCYDLFKNELSELLSNSKREITVEKEIVVAGEESQSKEKGFLRNIFSCYETHSDVYMDLTFGTKLTSVEMFSSLHYAEIIKNCTVKAVIYGKYSFDDSEIGELYDAASLYHTIRLLDTAIQMKGIYFDDLLNQIIDD